jgi:hypothetical protein
MTTYIDKLVTVLSEVRACVEDVRDVYEGHHGGLSGLTEEDRTEQRNVAAPSYYRLSLKMMFMQSIVDFLNILRIAGSGVPKDLDEFSDMCIEEFFDRRGEILDELQIVGEEEGGLLTSLCTYHYTHLTRED